MSFRPALFSKSDEGNEIVQSLGACHCLTVGQVSKQHLWNNKYVLNLLHLWSFEAKEDEHSSVMLTFALGSMQSQRSNFKIWT